MDDAQDPVELIRESVEGQDLSLTTFGLVRAATFAGVKLRGATFTMQLTDVVFRDCDLTECRFRLTTLKQVVFERCLVHDCDFYGSELHEVSFPGSEVHGVGFDACSLAAVDLSEATSLLIADPRTLKGSKIAAPQVAGIAHRLAELSGIEVEP